MGEHSRSRWRFAGAVAVYGLLGPLVGAIGVTGLSTILAVGAAVAQGEFGDIARLLWGGLVVGTIVTAIIAYSVGIASAVGVGVAVASRDWRSGGISWRVALVSAVIFWLLTSVAIGTAVPAAELTQWVAALFVAHLLAVAACTWLARRLFGQPPTARA